ncbi:cholesterol 25-hydroxylase-like protein [Stemphylium lycopersici]|nr:cholesterol 25-hydroxylase-like protein [Stemphylium lycopersici]
MPAATLYVLYNADASVLGKLKYGYRKLSNSSADNPACAACDITHGGLSLSETPGWKDAKKQIEAGSGCQVVQWHKDELSSEMKEFVSANNVKYPAVVAKGDGGLEVAVTSSELATFKGDAAMLVKKLQEKGNTKMKPKSNKDALVFRLRLAIGSIFMSAILFPTLYAPLLVPLWSWLQSNAIYRLSTFETIWTVFLYAAIEPYMTVVFLRHPEWRFGGTKEAERSKPRGMRRPSRRLGEMVMYVVPLLTLDLTMIKKFAGVPLERMLESGNYHFHYQDSHGQSATFLVPSLHNMTASSPLQTQRALPEQPPSSRRVALELVTSLVLYDVLFFLFHLTLHVLPGIKRWHAPHHRHTEMHPQITNQLHVVERLGLVLLANFSLNIIGSHVLTRTLFVPVFVWLLVEIHSGLDLPWGYEKILPDGWGGGARKHMLHHAGGGRGYAPYFSWCDTLLQKATPIHRTETPQGSAALE